MPVVSLPPQPLSALCWKVLSQGVITRANSSGPGMMSEAKDYGRTWRPCRHTSCCPPAIRSWSGTVMLLSAGI
jgi:hypothetical protein